MTITQFTSQLRDLFDSYVFWSAAISWFICQLIKSIIAAFTASDNKLKSFIISFGKTGGIPSSHTGIVVSLCIAFGLKEGFNSDVFILSFFLASIVIRDAIGVRLSNGVQARTLNSLGDQVSEKLDIPFLPVREINGHTKFQVFVGGVIGFITTFILFSLFN